MGKVKICKRCKKLTGKESFSDAHCVCTDFEKADFHGRQNEEKCIYLILNDKQ